MRIAPTMMVPLLFSLALFCAVPLHAQRGVGVPLAQQKQTSNAIELMPSAAADSIYANGRLALNQGRFDVAIAAFTAVTARYPVAYVAPNAWYWRAYAQHRRSAEPGDVKDLLDAFNSLLVHQSLYTRSHNRSDVMELFARVRGALVARQSELTPADTNLVRAGSTYPFCSMRVTGPISARLQSLGELAPELAARTLSATVFGEGMCVDLTLAGPLYRRLGNLREAKELVIAALGRSIHQSGSTQLLEIVRTETDERLRELAAAWLKVRSEPGTEPMFRGIM